MKNLVEGKIFDFGFEPLLLLEKEPEEMVVADRVDIAPSRSNA